MVNNNQIKRNIKRQIKGSFPSNGDLEELIESFLSFVQYPLNDSFANLDGIETRLLDSITILFEDGTNKKDIAFAEFVKFEPYLRKILYLVDRGKLNIIESGKKGLSPLIKALGLNPESKDIYILTPEILKGENFHVEHLCRAYHLRNRESHHCIDFTQLELALNIQSVLIVYLHVTFLYLDKIKKTIDVYGINKYLKREIASFTQWKESFVHIDGKEVIDIDIYAKELCPEEIDAFEERQGTINYLRHSIEENQMVILGEVGMGKSTTLQYLHYKDAEDCYIDNSKQIPIYLELKYTDESENITNKLITKLGFEPVITEDLLKKGRFNIFLDGLNEIDKNIRNKIYKQIERFIYEYQLNQIIVTSRPLSYNREFDSSSNGRTVPVFLLQLMAKNQIEEFLDKNGSDVKDKILKEITSNLKLKEIVISPLILKMLVDVVRRTDIIPNNKALIIKEFISNTLQREKKIEDFDIEFYNSLLEDWAYRSRQLTNSNSGLNQNNIVIPFFNDLRERLGKTNFDVWNFLGKMRDIHLFTKEGNLLSFTHELYQEYFAAEYLSNEYSDIDIAENLRQIIDNSSWEEIIILYTGLIRPIDKREHLIKNIITLNPFLGLKCEKNSIFKNNDIESFIISCSKRNIETRKEKKLKINSIQALIGLNQYEYIIDYIKTQKGASIPTIKSIVYIVLSRNVEHHNLWEIIKVFFDANPNYYIADINKFISDNRDNIKLDHELITEILKNLLYNDVKFHHVINFLRLLKLDSIANLPIEDSYVLNIVPKTNNINDILYFIKLFNKNISSVLIIQKIIQEGETSSLFMLSYYMNLLQKDFKVLVIKELFNSDIDTRIIVGLMFIKKYNLEKDFIVFLRSRPDYSNPYRKIDRVFHQNDITTLVGFMSVLSVARQGLNILKEVYNLDKYLHSNLACWVLTELPYHFLLGSRGIDKIKILLPKDEIELEEMISWKRKKVNVYITHIDKKTNRMYASRNGINSFKEEYKYILKENDIFECRINISDKGQYYVEPLSLGKRIVKFKIDPEKHYVHTRRYKAKVKRVIDYDKIEFDIIEG